MLLPTFLTATINLNQAAQTHNLQGANQFPGTGNQVRDALIGRFLTITLAIAALLVFGYLIWGGIEWISAGGDKAKIEKARDKITGSVTGMIVLASAVAFMVVLQGILQVTFFTFV